jgi:hypothetical protein
MQADLTPPPTPVVAIAMAKPQVSPTCHAWLARPPPSCHDHIDASVPAVVHAGGRPAPRAPHHYLLPGTSQRLAAVMMILMMMMMMLLTMTPRMCQPSRGVVGRP